MIFKDLDIELKDYSQKSENDQIAIVKIAIAGLGNIDSDGDRILAGATKKTVSERLSKIIHLKNHDRRLDIGVPREIYEDGDNVIAISMINLGKQIGREQMSDYLFRANLGRTVKHSIGFIGEKFKKNNENGYDFTEIKLMEYSSLSFLPANDNTPFLEQLKQYGPNNVKELEKIINYYTDKLQKLMKSNEPKTEPDKTTQKIISLDYDKLISYL